MAKLPFIKDLAALIKQLKPTIQNNYRATIRQNGVIIHTIYRSFWP